MKKKLLIILIVIAVIIITPIIAFRIYCSLPRIDEKIIAGFSPYRDDFEIVNNYVLENFVAFYGGKAYIAWDSYGNLKSISFNSKEYCPDESVSEAFEKMEESLGKYSLNYIEVTPNRINYIGLSEVMLTYSKNGRKPRYFYHWGDGVTAFFTYPLWDNWFYLDRFWL